MEYVITLMAFLIILGVKWISKPEKNVNKEHREQEKPQNTEKTSEKEGKTTMIYKATEMISETFDQYGIKYRTAETENLSYVEAGYNIECGPFARVVYFSSRNENDVQIRIFGLMNKVPEEKRTAMVDACNSVNNKIRYYKFYLDPDNDLLAEYDLPLSSADERVGENCYEMFVRATQILDTFYHVFAEAVYRTSPAAKEFSDTIDALKYLRDHPITIPQEDKGERM